ncbi:S-adenosyl-L-methionine-dependent methyltransferase [Amniculicola lignicola CBS 123094]|uniref:S-adenosyl-L-methionine-dependent methyltransferase n=1 Tax=Amniculicola lignicola CBS 123094 TaxID=1392246 RepID=A0A6A5WRQ1_9PLEO|nr:S-adenosyl-L-methionine-dependent methyltransferase [Amniculicola lignicola CBS 123094]
MTPERQADSIVHLYESQAFETNVLDLACGTGLLPFLEADVVGTTGSLVGIDVTPGVLAEAKAKKERGGDDYAHVQFYEGDALNLEKIEALRGKTFDMITLASALYWASYLKPGGILAMDSMYPQNLVSDMVLERTGQILNLAVPSYRKWSQLEDSLSEVLVAAGFESGEGRRWYDVSEASDLFAKTLANGNAAKTFADNELRTQADLVFCGEFEKLAVDRKVEEVDVVFLGIARKPLQASNQEVNFSGGCRCGSVRYISTAPPSEITYCHCRACQQLSGSAFLPFIADRTYCSSCGTPITMVYHFEGGDEDVSITVGSIDMHHFRGEMPKTKQHIFVSERAPWFTIPDDGVPRQQTMRSLSKLSQTYPNVAQTLFGSCRVDRPDAVRRGARALVNASCLLQRLAHCLTTTWHC